MFFYHIDWYGAIFLNIDWNGTILFFTILISIFTTPFLIQAGHHASAVLIVFFLLFITFAAGYRVAAQDKDDRTETLIYCLKHKAWNAIRLDDSTNALSEKEISQLIKRVQIGMDKEKDDYFEL